MKTWISDGNVIPVVCPAGGSTSGAGLIVGSMFGIANDTVAAGVTVGLALFGQFYMAKATGTAWTAGQILYWDNTAKNVTTVSSGNTKIGYAVAAALSADTVGTVILTLGGA